MRAARTISWSVCLWACLTLASLRGALGASAIESSLPASTLAGVSISVTNAAQPASDVSVYAVEDLLPPGWTADQISHGGRFDTITRKVKWGLFFDNTPRDLTFRATPPAGASGLATFSGVGLFNSTTVPIIGQRSCTVVSSVAGSQVAAAMPSYYLAGVAFTLSEASQPAANVKTYAIEETLPVGWTASSISHGGRFDAANHKLKWGPFADATPRLLTAQILPPPDANTAIELDGVASFDGLSIPIVGAREILPWNHSVTRALPEFFCPGVAFTVTLAASPVPGALSYAIEEMAPAGWQISSISHSGQMDEHGRTVRWGPFFDDASRTVSYTIIAPPGSTGTYPFLGRGSFDGLSVTTGGRSETTAFTSAVARALPTEATPGAPFNVSYAVSPADGALAQALQDEIPPGWSVSAISDGGEFDAGERMIRWGPFYDGNPRTLTCQITPPADAVGIGYFSGNGSFDGLSQPITGQTLVRLVSVRQANQIARLMPATTMAGATFTVRLSVTVADSVRDYAVEDIVPPGWTVSSISSGGQFDGVNQRVKWGPFADNFSRLVSYQISSPTNASGAYPFLATASFDGVSISEEGSILVFQPITPPNQPPEADDITYMRAPNLTLKIRVADLIANATHDAENDPRSLKSLGPSGQGATITVSGPFILYAPVNNNNDSFTYTIQDALGRTATGHVIIQVVNAASRVTAIHSLAGVVTLQFFGVPSYQYQVQRSGFVNGPWTTIKTLSAGADGAFSYAETPPHAPAFYRLYQP